jgi:hypothetical protein
MQETTYKGYRIKYHCTTEWFAHIYRPGSNSIMSGPIITASREDGEQVLLSRVYARIDQEESAANKP